MVKIKINSKECEVEEGITVLEAARRQGIDIPTLCHHDAIGPYGACRLCVVEVESPLLRRILTSACNLKVSEGLSVETESPLVKTSRNVIFELLLGRSPDSKPLRELAKKFGVESTRFATGSSDDCVRCGLCVRICRDKIGVSAISFAGRGQGRRVTAEFGKLSETCIGCGACASICPTGAIRLEDKGDRRKIFLWDTLISTFTLVRCESCGVPYTTRKLFDHVSARSAIKAETANDALCPECARRHYAEAITGKILPY